MTEFFMKAADPATSLRFSNMQGDYFDITLETPTLSVVKKIFNYTYASTSGFLEFFEQLASFGSPWGHEVSWEALEGDLQLAATCDALGHVTIKTSISSHRDNDKWQVDCTMIFEFGSLSKFASDAKRFAGQLNQR